MAAQGLAQGSRLVTALRGPVWVPGGSVLPRWGSEAGLQPGEGPPHAHAAPGTTLTLSLHREGAWAPGGLPEGEPYCGEQPRDLGRSRPESGGTEWGPSPTAASEPWCCHPTAPVSSPAPPGVLTAGTPQTPQPSIWHLILGFLYLRRSLLGSRAPKPGFTLRLPRALEVGRLPAGGTGGGLGPMGCGCRTNTRKVGPGRRTSLHGADTQ